ncbi:2020_t:CDS:2, partial [Dentiscutata erythropus]
MNYAIFAKYGTSILNEKSKVQYTIFRNDDLYDRSDHAEGYFKSTKCLGNREYQELLAQIDCAIILNLKGELNSL